MLTQPLQTHLYELGMKTNSCRKILFLLFASREECILDPVASQLKSKAAVEYFFSLTLELYGNSLTRNQIFGTYGIMK